MPPNYSWQLCILANEYPCAQGIEPNRHVQFLSTTNCARNWGFSINAFIQDLQFTRFVKFTKLVNEKKKKVEIAGVNGRS